MENGSKEKEKSLGGEFGKEKFAPLPYYMHLLI